MASRIKRPPWAEVHERSTGGLRPEISTMQIEGTSSIQNLASFRLPKNFRGRSALTVQLWWLVQATLFRGSPQFLYAFRRWLLRRFGAEIGVGVRVRPSATLTYPWRVKKGSATTPGSAIIW